MRVESDRIGVDAAGMRVSVWNAFESKAGLGKKWKSGPFMLSFAHRYVDVELPSFWGWHRARQVG